MSALHARQALTPDGWADNVRLTVADGRIAAIETDVAPAPGDALFGALVPGLPNLHSHAFQRAMAGMAEIRGPAEDNFWSWRTAMYRFALEMTPDQMEAVAAQLYMEMVEAGFSRVGEFHYLHHERDGRPYAHIGELAERIAAASRMAGIALTLLPVYYAHSDFGGQPPVDGQRRFVSTIEDFARLMEASRTIVDGLPGGILGVAPHSLRAVTPGELAAVADLCPEGPIHIHAAEQTREVEACLAVLKARPVEWLLDNAAVDRRWCLIHATHLSGAETGALARSGAVAGLCPITEANLGDGIFNAPDFLAAGGAFGIGSDSNVLISAAGELRQLEYAQRLGLRKRNVIAEPFGSTGRRLFDGALSGGGQALAAPVGLAPGRPADIVALATPSGDDWRGDQWLDQWIFAGGARVDAVWIGGRKWVEEGRHVAREAIASRFAATMRGMAS